MRGRQSDRELRVSLRDSERLEDYALKIKHILGKDQRLTQG